MIPAREMTGFAWIVVWVSGAALLGWLALLGRMRLTLGNDRPVKPTVEPVAADAPVIHAIVAARNEEAFVEASVRSLLSQEYPKLTITVVDDQSTDATGSILDRLAREPAWSGRLGVIHGVERPAGWVGKTWALEQGQQAAKTEWLWFVDGDLVFHPRALATGWEYAKRTGADLISFLPGVECETVWQGVISVFLPHLMTWLFPLSRLHDPSRPLDALAAGGFLLIRREVYQRAGGHAAVRNEILEDIQLARRVKAIGAKIHVGGAPELFTTHMYGTLSEIWRGIRKNAFAIFDYSILKATSTAIVALILVWAPLLALLFGLARLASGATAAPTTALIALGTGGWLIQALPTAVFVHFLRLPYWYSFTLPAGVTLYAAIVGASIRDHQRGWVYWKGRALAVAESTSQRRAG